MTRKRILRTIPHIKLPEIGETSYLILGTKILFIHLDYDQDPPNPCKDWDGTGQIRSFSTRHIDNIDPEEAVALLKSDPDVIPLSYFEHGNSLWMVKELPAPAGVEFDWDGVRFAGIWIPDDCVRESYTGQDNLSRRDWMIQQAKLASKTYTDFCNGNCYGYDVQLHTARKDDDGEVITDLDYYRHHTPLGSDSCWGFYGWDYFKDEVLSIVKISLKGLKFSRRAIDEAIKEAA